MIELHRYLRLLAKNPSRLADEIPLRHYLEYESIDHVAPELQTGFLRRFIDMDAWNS